jgi:Right handed beta helix region/RTX calcium-binding nonapeptide repeat (4 copies)
MKRSLVALALAVSVLVAVPEVAGAASITVTTTADVVNGGDGVISLREAFAMASANAEADEIVLGVTQTYQLTDCVAGALLHTAAEGLTLTGNGSTIEQTCPGEGVIDDSTAVSTLAVDGVTFTGAAGGGFVEGAGVLVAGDTSIANSTFTGLDAGTGSIVAGSSAFFGVDLTLDTVTIDGNTGDGVVLSFGSLHITDSAVTGNVGRGIALVDGSPLVITDSEISGNSRSGARTTGQGSTITTLTNATIVDNGETGLACSACGTVTITDSTITGNGNALGPFGGGRGVSVTLDQDDPADAPTVTITGSTISDNTSTLDGAGLAVTVLESSEPTAPSAQITLTDSDVSDNVVEDAATAVHGGGIYLETGSLTLTGTTVTGNRAGPVAGGTLSEGGGVWLQETGAITTPPTLTITGSHVDGNQADRRGGGIRVVTGGAVTITDSTVSGNTAHQGDAGGIYTIASTSISGSEVSDNTAPNGGGIAVATAFDQPAGSLDVVGSTLAGNDATVGGGGALTIDIEEGLPPVVVENSTISGNTAATAGGGIRAGLGGDITLRHATLVENQAPAGANLSMSVVVGGLDVTAAIIALPLGGGANCAITGGAPTSGGFSFVSDTSCSLGGDDTVSAADPQLAALALNGGPTPNRLPAAASPVGGLVPAAMCSVPADQRGVARPEGTNCEPGSVEVEEAGGGGGPEPIMGTNGKDVLFGTPGDDVIMGLGGKDLIFGLGGNDVIIGGDGNDTIFGGPGDDTLEGNRGRDILVGGPGDDDLDGGPGVDACWDPFFSFC